MKQNETKFRKKIEPKFHCELCDYYTNRKSNFIRHLDTIKHFETKIEHEKILEKKAFLTKNKEIYNGLNINRFNIKAVTNSNTTSKTSKNEQLLPTAYDKIPQKTSKSKSMVTLSNKCIYCSKKFNSRTTLWRHSKKCQMNKELKILNLEKQLTQIKNNTKIVNNFNINIFLKETCHQAMTIQDFTKTLQFTMDDIIIANTDKIKCLANIFIKNLKPLSISQRPLHYLKKNEWFINNENYGWREENAEALIKYAQCGVIKHCNKFFNNGNTQDILDETYINITNIGTIDISKKKSLCFETKVKNICMIKEC